MFKLFIMLLFSCKFDDKIAKLFTGLLFYAYCWQLPNMSSQAQPLQLMTPFPCPTFQTFYMYLRERLTRKSTLTPGRKAPRQLWLQNPSTKKKTSAQPCFLEHFKISVSCFFPQRWLRLSVSSRRLNAITLVNVTTFARFLLLPLMRPSTGR